MTNRDKGLSIVRVRLEREAVLGYEPVNTQDKAVEFIAREFADLDREVFMVLNLDAQCRPINMNVVSMGTLNYTVIHPREVFKASLLSGANQIICFHNHPSGDVKPSEDDIKVTDRLRECGRILGIDVADHFIIGGPGGTYYSFREHDWDNTMEKGYADRNFAAEKRL